MNNKMQLILYLTVDDHFQRYMQEIVYLNVLNWVSSLFLLSWMIFAVDLISNLLGILTNLGWSDGDWNRDTFLTFLSCVHMKTLDFREQLNHLVRETQKYGTNAAKVVIWASWWAWFYFSKPFTL